MFKRNPQQRAEKRLNRAAMKLYEHLARELDKQSGGRNNVWIGSPDYLLFKCIPEGYRCLRVTSLERDEHGNAYRVHYRSLYLVSRNNCPAFFVSEDSQDLEHDEDWRKVATYPDEDPLYILVTNPQTPSKEEFALFSRLVFRQENSVVS